MTVKPLAQEPMGMDPSKIYIWVKGLESKVNNLTRETDVLKNDSIRKTNELRKDLKAVNDDLLELRREVEKVQEKMDLIIRELQKTAGREEVLVLKKYLELWNPLSFVTQKDLDRAIDAKLALKNPEKMKDFSNE